MILAINNHDEFHKYLVRAILIHIGLGLIIFMLKYILGIELFTIEPSKKEVKVIESAVRIDVVAMPKLTVQELKKVNIQDTTPEPVAEVKEESKPNETSDVEFKKVKKVKKVNLSSLLSNLSKNDVVKKKVKKKEKPKIDQKELKKLVLEGNIVSKGQTAVGSGETHSDEVFVNYIQSLPDKVRPHWKLPSYLLEKELRCRLQVFVAANGKVLRIAVYESSGDTEYDEKAIAAVKAASPFPSPAREILARVTSGDVILGFPL